MLHWSYGSMNNRSLGKNHFPLARAARGAWSTGGGGEVAWVEGRRQGSTGAEAGLAMRRGTDQSFRSIWGGGAGGAGADGAGSAGQANCRANGVSEGTAWWKNPIFTLKTPLLGQRTSRLACQLAPTQLEQKGRRKRLACCSAFPLNTSGRGTRPCIQESCSRLSDPPPGPQPSPSTQPPSPPHPRLNVNSAAVLTMNP